MPFTSDTFKMYPVTGGNPDNNTSPLGGELDTEFEWVEGVNSFTVNAPIDSVENTVVYGLAGWAVAAGVGDTLTELRVALRTALEPNTLRSGVEFTSTSASDNGAIKIRGLVDGEEVIETVTLEGTSAVFTVNEFDAESVTWIEYVKGGSPTPPVGQITCAASGQILGVIFGTSSGHGVYQINSLVKIAVGSAKNQQIAWSATNNRLTAPDINVSAFARASQWVGNDNALTPGYTLTGGDWFHVCVELTLLANMSVPPESGAIQIGIMPTGIEV